MLLGSRVVDRHARMRPGADGLQHLVRRRVQFERGHLVARHHAVADPLVGQAKDVLHELGLIVVENAGFFRVLDEQQQFLDGMDHLLAGDCLEAEAAQDAIGEAVHEQNHAAE